MLTRCAGCGRDSSVCDSIGGMPILVIALCLIAQTFTPSLPETIPAVQGSVAAPFTMRYIDVEPGTGAAAQPGQRYIVHYTGWLRDGTKFDSSRGRDKPFSFVQGRRQVIAGWESGHPSFSTTGPTKQPHDCNRAISTGSRSSPGACAGFTAAASSRHSRRPLPNSLSKE